MIQCEGIGIYVMLNLLKHVPPIERRAAVLSLGTGIVLLLVKFGAYFLTGSTAIFADALEGIVNVTASGFAMYALVLAHRPADPEHPYGHGKIEFFSAGFEGGMILLAAIVAVGKALDTLVRHQHLRHQRVGDWTGLDDHRTDRQRRGRAPTWFEPDAGNPPSLWKPTAGI